jgi:hypothetical protein
MEAAKIFDRLVNAHRATGGTEAIVDFTVNGKDFSLTACNGVMVIWYDDEGQAECLFSNEPQDREGLIEWLNVEIGEAIQ